MDWNNPSDRGALIERVGSVKYNEAFLAHIKADAVATVNGYHILPVVTRFGRLFQVFGTDKAFRELQQAKDYATQSPKGAA